MQERLGCIQTVVKEASRRKVLSDFLLKCNWGVMTANVKQHIQKLSYFQHLFQNWKNTTQIIINRYTYIVNQQLVSDRTTCVLCYLTFSLTKSVSSQRIPLHVCQSETDRPVIVSHCDGQWLEAVQTTFYVQTLRGLRKRVPGLSQD